MLLFTLFLGFLVGALTIVALEVVGVVFVISRLNRKIKAEEAKAASSSSLQLQSPSRGLTDLDGSLHPSSNYQKSGVVWVLEPEKVPKSWPVDKMPREQKHKKEIFEVVPVRKLAKVKDQSLVLTELDGSQSEVLLKGCTVEAVSATATSSRKWAKRYPIKVESKTSVLYKTSKTLYIYLETSWEKESWCKALRLASCKDKGKLRWFSNLNLDFQSYLTTLCMEHPSFIKSPAGFDTAPVDRSIKHDGSSSKVRQFLKKLAKKVPKSGVENKMSGTLGLGREEKKISEKYHSIQDSILGTGMVKTASTGKAPNVPEEEKMVPPPTFAQSDSRSHSSMFSDADSDNMVFSDEGTHCWNLLISRLFFDAKSNTKMKNFMQARIQRTLSNMRTPSYIGQVTCTGIDLGNLPPHINGMRVLPLEMNEVWALEIDFQYSGGVVLDIETRLEVHELDFEGGLVDTNSESSSVEVTSDLLEGFEYFGKQLELSENTVDATERRDEVGSKLDGMKSSKGINRTPSSVSRWKSILNCIAKQVSQVPLSLALRVASLQGTLRLRIKPPPSEELWFGFMSMPDIDFNLESFVGEHKINSGHIAAFLINRLKTAIRETLVLPNCESVCIPWMIAEKDDWVPQKVAPFIWINHESVTDPIIVPEVASSHPEVTPMANVISSSSRESIGEFREVKDDREQKVEGTWGPIGESYDARALSYLATTSTSSSRSSLQDLSTPLLRNEGPQQACVNRGKEENLECQQPTTRALMSTGEQVEGDDGFRQRRMGTRARMLGLGKKMGEKLEEKRRHIEEKGRTIVERMRAP